MKLEKAKELGDELLSLNKLKGWSTTFLTTTKLKLGHCDYEKKEIALSPNFVLSSKKADVRQVILHEIAHALVGDKVRSHGKEWKNKAKELGVKKSFAVANIE